MSFGTPIFLFLLLPATLTVYFLVKSNLKNTFLLLVSIIFYSWGNVETLTIINISIIANYLFGLTINKDRVSKSKRKYIFVISIIFNLLLLFLFKYTDFFISNFLPFLNETTANSLNFAADYSIIGLSFFTFQSISYLTDIYSDKIKPEKNFIDFALYISFFPKLIAGPIIRYNEFEKELKTKVPTADVFLAGINRFIFGLGKKTIIGDTAGKIANNIFALSNSNLNIPLAWIGLICFTLQIYFDFSGYTDMAIGIGKMFGFNLPENFNYPYISKSIKEFWQRWHISLSTWLKDYLYIPLGGNRNGKYRTYLNLFIVFVLCGFWHGSNWNFILWGAWHGIFTVLEKTSFGNFMESRKNFVRHIYALSVIMIGWVFFKTTSATDGLLYIGKLFGFGSTSSVNYSAMYLNNETITILIIGLFFSLPIYQTIKKHFESSGIFIKKSLYLANIVFVSIIFLLAISTISTQTYVPFIYQQF